MPNIIYDILKKFDPINPNITTHSIKNVGGDFVTDLLKIVRENDDEIGAKAAWVLGELKDDSAIPVFSKILEQSEYRNKPQIIWALSKTKNRETAPLLIKMLEDKDFDVRISAAGVLGEIGENSAVSPLINHLGDKNSRVADFCCIALQKIGIKAMDNLIDAANNENPDIRKHVVRALKSIPEKEVLKTLESLFDKEEEEKVRIEIMCSAGAFKSGTDILIKGLKDKCVKVRCQAAKSLGFNANERAIEPLGEIVQNDEEPVKINAIRSLAKAINEKSFNYITSAIDDSSQKVRMEMIHAIMNYEFEKSVPFYSILLSDISEEVSMTAIWAMELSGGEKAMDIIIQVLEDDKRMGVRAFAAKTLGKIAHNKALTPLRFALRDADSKTIAIINRAINNIDIMNRKNKQVHI